ncbi:hypothetical protein BDV41DRAFT_573233 [Aspergillus transmontanensis]|uniref:Uncharacterized protein n=1 Tax=Aspergillus transmontanensis TaxID=1034304 RepID=A0A5N6WCJ4_9EURO|nr:hypothetical protein BDV41DRAFT_573233 [Aspergillus transmontanensis]
MVLMIKALRAGLGLSSEAIHAVRDNSASRKESSSTPADPSSTPPDFDLSTPYPGLSTQQTASSMAHQESSTPCPDHYSPYPQQSVPPGTPAPHPGAFVSYQGSYAPYPGPYAPCGSEGIAPDNDELFRSISSECGVNPNDVQKTTNGTEATYDLESNYGDGFNQDKEAWELDDIAERVRSRTDEEAPAMSPNEPEDVMIKKREAMVRKLVSMAGPPTHSSRRLPCPVIIPQRRPRKKDRGFVRAYAPVLADCGISQDVFMEFLEDLDQVNKVRSIIRCLSIPLILLRILLSFFNIRICLQYEKASRWIEVVFVAGAIVGCIPSATATAIGFVIQVVAGTARELQSRHRKNTFLDRVNQDLLMPRGLYAMIMSFKDQQEGLLRGLSGATGQALFTKKELDINETVEKYSNPDPNMSKFKKGLKNVRLVSGKTHGELELPEAAALLYPHLDRAAAEAAQGETGMRDKLKYAGEWVNDYLDRRAHAHCEAQHPGTALAVPSDKRKPLRSRFNDPKHPANSGSLISLLTGGHVPVPGIDKMLDMTLEQSGIKRLVRGQPAGHPPNAGLSQSSIERVINKKLHEDVLYLLIVNLPSKEEVQ